MGCVFPKSAFYDSNPRVFHVWNVDDRGNHVNPGRIEVTDTELILYQKGKPPIRWPLRSLRRYGCDAELFSFESGRRCPTGPGIYAFKCHRAEALFNILQECVQNCGGGLGPGGSGIGGSGPDDIISLSTSGVTVAMSNSLPNGNLHSHLGTDSSGYLEPITTSNQQRCSIVSQSNQRGFGSAPDGFLYLASGNGPTSPGVVGVSPQRGGASGSHISTGCCSTSCTRGNNPHYVNDDVLSPTSRTNPSNVAIGGGHQYMNSSAVTADNSRSIMNTSNQWHENEVLYVNNPSLCSPPPCGQVSSHSCANGSCTAHHCSHPMMCVDHNTNYAKLDDLLKQDHTEKFQKDQHFYMNVNPGNSDVQNVGTANGKTATRMAARSLPRNSAITMPSNLATRNSSVRFYANLSSPSVPDQTGNESGEEDRQMNYIEVEPNKVSSPVVPPTTVASPPCSPFKMPEGYVTIDFDKTAALSNSAKPSLSHDESVRKTRHNGTIPLTSLPS